MLKIQIVIKCDYPFCGYFRCFTDVNQVDASKKLKKEGWVKQRHPRGGDFCPQHAADAEDVEVRL